VRTTVTLEKTLAAGLRNVARRTGRSFERVLDETLRRGLLDRSTVTRPKRFVVRARNLGRMRPGISLDGIAALLERIEGSARR